MKIRLCLTRQDGTDFGKNVLTSTDLCFEENAEKISKRPDIKRDGDVFAGRVLG